MVNQPKRKINIDPLENLTYKELIQIRKRKLQGKSFEDKEYIFPLYFGWEMAIQHVDQWKKHLLGPFKAYWQYMTVVVLLIAATSFYFFINRSFITLGATYTFEQGSWTGGVSATTATHTSDREGWDKYSAKDSTISAGASLALQETSNPLTQASSTDFTAGTTSNTAVEGPGMDAFIRLSGSTINPMTTSTIALSSTPSDMVYDPINDKVWAAWNGNLVKIDTAGSISATYTTGVPSSIYGMDYDEYNDSIWVAASSPPNNLFRFSASSGVLQSSHTLNGAQLNDVTFDSRNNLIWVTDYTYKHLWRIDATDLTSSSTYTLDTTYLYDNLAFDPISDKIWVTRSGSPNAAVGYNTDGTASTTCNAITAAANQIIFEGTTPAIWLSNSIATTGRVNKILVSDCTRTGYYAGTTGRAGGLAYETFTDSIWVGDNDDGGLNQVGRDGVVKAYYILNSNQKNYLVYVPTRAEIWSSDTSNILIKTMGTFNSSGTFTSSIIDTGLNPDYGTATWVSTEPTSTSVSVKVRTSNDSGMSGATDWASCSAVTKDADISANGCVTDGHRYVQYQLTLATSDTEISPLVHGVTINYNSYTSGTLTSSVFDTENSGNVLGSIVWTEGGSGIVKYQIQTSADNSAWSGWLGPTSGDDYYTDPAGTDTINSSHRDGSGDRYVQYKLFLESTNGTNTPTVDDIIVTYVVNAPPDFEAAATASQNADGTVTINYSVRDIDTTSGTATRGYITPSFKYSINNGGDWNDITIGLSMGATSTKAVDEVSYTDYQATWTPKDQIDGVYTAQAKIRVVADDSEGANNTAASDTTAFALDVKDPVAGSPGVIVVATTTPASLTLSATDDSSLEMCISLDNTESNCVAYNTAATASLSTNPDTVYAIFRDAFGNTASANAVTPQTPSNIIIRDISNTDSGDYRLFVSWGSVSTPLDEFNYYRLWHSTDGSNYTLLTSIDDRSVNYYLHEGLVNGESHYYKVATEDNDGDVSYFSSAVSDTVDGQGGTDSTSPTISTVQSTQVNTQSAVIRWNTDEISNSTVGFSATPGNFDNEVGVATMKDNSDGLGQHIVTLTGLNPNTTYYYQVISEDPTGNSSTDNNGGDGYSLTTLSGPVISNVSASLVQNTSATITWNTDSASASSVYYSTNSDLSESSSVTGSSGLETEHSVTISGLSSGTKYYYYVVSGVAIDNNAGEYYSFITTSDSTAPVITGVDASVVTDVQAAIVWVTNEASTSKVNFGTVSGDLASSTSKLTNLDINHYIVLSELENSTKYYYTVTSGDGSGNYATSTESDFTTQDELYEGSEVDILVQEAQAQVQCVSGGGGGVSIDATAPVISEIKVDTSNHETVSITWKTNENAISIVNYGIDNVDDHSAINQASIQSQTTSHAVLLTGVQPDATYNYKVISIDRYGNIATSAAGTFSTASFIVTEPDEDISPEARDQNFINVLKQTSSYLTRISAEVSLGALEQGLIEYYSDLSELSNFVPPPIISGQPSISVSSDAAVIRWQTDKQANSLVSYAAVEYYTSTGGYQQTVGDPNSFVVDHEVTIWGLLPETEYHYRLTSRSQAGVLSESRDFLFRTTSKVAQIENYTTEVVSPNEAIFKWITSVPSTSEIQYTPYINGQLVADEVLRSRSDVYTTIHNIGADDFEAGVNYRVELTGQTLSGERISQIIPYFATSDDNLPPFIEQVKTDAALSLGKDVKVQAIISWTTNEASTSRVYFQKGAGRSDEILAESTPLSASPTKKHVVVITDFDPGAIYRFQVESIDSDGNVSRSRTYTILTPRQQESVFQIIVKNVETTFGWLGIFRR